ncbi:DNA-directed RNA polymerase subunit beta [Psychrobacillus sp. OK028]|uniref:DNA-directed RNA polymerase subunit beta n=1 Tax=Psychrobacillus sp. OK028 TaxID=1884359 RepID=UPI0008866328|nr:DNA-directed RNA polymerase subunit beta [Psychrobacillus sp. OK028]SDN23071.1 DNA-directed RNA polymerase subunit beta [Psychrobacillus sp. OK028]
MTEESKISARQQRRLEKEQEKAHEQAQQTGTTRWVQIRMFPIWLRILLVILILAGAAITGLMFGYGVLGDGEPKDALKWDTYQHIIDIKDGK